MRNDLLFSLHAKGWVVNPEFKLDGEHKIYRLRTNDLGELLRMTICGKCGSQGYSEYDNKTHTWGKKDYGLCVSGADEQRA